MRLTPEDIAHIYQGVNMYCAGHTAIWLFGSMLDEQASGGDVDLYLEPSPPLPTNVLLAHHTLEREWERRLRRPVDGVIGREPLTAFMRQARTEGRRL
ncbi:MAG: nucleotidyltransferase domain-containing protein [Thermochromatium sp.]